MRHEKKNGDEVTSAGGVEWMTSATAMRAAPGANRAEATVRCRHRAGIQKSRIASEGRTAAGRVSGQRAPAAPCRRRRAPLAPSRAVPVEAANAVVDNIAAGGGLAGVLQPTADSLSELGKDGYSQTRILELGKDGYIFRWLRGI